MKPDDLEARIARWRHSKQKRKRQLAAIYDRSLRQLAQAQQILALAEAAQRETSAALRIVAKLERGWHESFPVPVDN